MTLMSLLFKESEYTSSVLNKKDKVWSSINFGHFLGIIPAIKEVIPKAKDKKTVHYHFPLSKNYEYLVNELENFNTS